ncbi:transposase [Kitasatospora sp. NPDC058048]|uniref:transposase n=1 Tax=Kitasatospora sp. NPDC058048 TaxID=3346313 RepID=UPI0036DAC0E3
MPTAPNRERYSSYSPFSRTTTKFARSATCPGWPTQEARHHRFHAATRQRGRFDADRLRQTPAALPRPKAADGRLVLAVDVSNRLRPDAEGSADRLLCHAFGRPGTDT